jgi:hypothetical protein
MLFRHMEASPMAIATRAGETLAAAIERGKAIRVRERERRRLETALQRECQFNRKVEINARLRQCAEELVNLQGL